MQLKWIVEKTIQPEDIETEDNGAARIVEISHDDSDLFVRIQSWDALKTHTEHRQLEGKRVRITIETLD
jgi:hypothetical protein